MMAEKDEVKCCDEPNPTEAWLQAKKDAEEAAKLKAAEGGE